MVDVMNTDDEAVDDKAHSEVPPADPYEGHRVARRQYYLGKLD